MAQIEDAGNAQHFLAGGGEMGARMRALDWSRTGLGPPEGWPQSLKTIVRVMLDSRYAMWMLWGPELTFFCNDAYLPTVGIKRDWVLGARSDKVWEEIWPDIGPRITRVLEQGQATWDEGLLLYLERSGFAEETYHTFSYSPVYDDHGRITGMLCVVTEVTQQILGERGLRVLRDLAARVGGAQMVRQAGEQLMSVLGDNPQDVPFACLYAVDDRQQTGSLIARCGTIPESLRPAEVSLAHAPWPIARAFASAEPVLVQLTDPEQSIAGPLWPDRVTQALVLPIAGPIATSSRAVLIAGVSPRRALDEGYRRFFDLVARQVAALLNDARAYEAERLRAEGLAELDRAKTQFFANVSHEFRTPLTLLLGPVEESLADPQTSLATRERLDLAHRNALRLLKLVNSLLDFSRIEAGRARASYQPTDAAALTRDLASTFRSTIERAGLRYDVRCEDIGELVHLDREMWEKVVLNLLSNAFKFTLEGAITVGLAREGDNAVLTVSDTGVGVPDEEIPRLFERFHRVEGTQGRTHEGSGIGLALVMELVKLHGGSVEVASELNRGTSFRVSIPLGMDHLPPDRIKTTGLAASTAIGARAFVQEALRWIQESGPDLDVPPASSESSSVAEVQRFSGTFGSRILLADDNADMRSYISTLLSPHYAVEAVADGTQALSAVTRKLPDLILSDVMMPNLDGLGLIAAIRADANLREIPVILLSARAGEEAQVGGLNAGADDYLVKPFSARELLARVGSILERTQLHLRARRQLEAADRQKDEFLAMLAHELRNPLAPIHNASELLARTLSPDARSSAAIAIVKRQVGHLTRLVDDLLDVSRITQGRIELRRRPVRVGEFIAQALETVEPLLRERRHRVTLESNGDSLHVNGDPARLVQCVANILTNAAKYTDATGEIRIESRAEGSMAVISIADNGVGIGPDLLPRVFDLFVQSQRTLDRAQGGLGIGLSVVKRLVALHGGEVSASSAGPGKGARFEIRLPAVSGAEASSTVLDAVKVRPRRLLIVDDNQDVTESLAMLLALDHHEVASVFTPQAALERVASFKPEIVLLDIGLPDIDGYELARRIRALPGQESIHLVALTGYGQAEDKQRAHAAGLDDHLVKPVDLATLQRTLARLS